MASCSRHVVDTRNGNHFYREWGFPVETKPKHLRIAEFGPDDVAEFYEGKARGLFFTCEHASNSVPSWIGSVSEPERAALDDHWGWDIGAKGLSRLLADTIDAPLVSSTLSRLVCDLNRDLDAVDLYRDECDGLALDFNRGLTPEDHRTRVALHATFHQFVERKVHEKNPSGLVSIHSFTPVWCGVPRQIEVGILFNRYENSARRIAEILARSDIKVGLNEPYSGFEDGVYSIERHGLTSNTPYIELEIRQDLISEPEGQKEWADKLAPVMTSSLFKAG